jgi:hypothetical protein
LGIAEGKDIDGSGSRGSKGRPRLFSVDWPHFRSVGGFASWLTHLVLTEKIKSKIRNEYDEKLETLKAQLKGQYDEKLETHKAQLKAQADVEIEKLKSELSITV